MGGGEPSEDWNPSQACAMILRIMAPARPKYQIFVSSTYTDLHEERREVTWAILKARHIPVGMENFPATDDRGWKTIKRLIDLSDYYVVRGFGNSSGSYQ